MQETQVQFLGQEDSLEKGMATHSSILAWRTPWTEKPGGLYSPWGHKELDMTKHTGERGAYYNYIYIYIKQRGNQVLAYIRDQIANIHWIIKKARQFQKNIYFCFIDYAKAFDCVDHKKLENSGRDENTRPPDLPLKKPICKSRSNSYNWTWNRLVPNRKRSTSRLYIVTLLI